MGGTGRRAAKNVESYPAEVYSSSDKQSVVGWPLSMAQSKQFAGKERSALPNTSQKKGTLPSRFSYRQSARAGRPGLSSYDRCCYFDKLPPEIRLMIWDELFAFEKSSFPMTGQSAKRQIQMCHNAYTKRTPGLLLLWTCRSCRTLVLDDSFHTCLDPSARFPAGTFNILAVCKDFYNEIKEHFWNNISFVVPNTRALINLAAILRSKGNCQDSWKNLQHLDLEGWGYRERGQHNWDTNAEAIVLLAECTSLKTLTLRIPLDQLLIRDVYRRHHRLRHGTVRVFNIAFIRWINQYYPNALRGLLRVDFKPSIWSHWSENVRARTIDESIPAAKFLRDLFMRPRKEHREDEMQVDEGKVEERRDSAQASGLSYRKP
ncbi:hypothetical protein H2203_003820 [Taxawa tesnikishii (nom. ined.)]|nr:hypothetical protein H2203_003820 [Dothideales sp. JES 119]